MQKDDQFPAISKPYQKALYSLILDITRKYCGLNSCKIH